MAKQIMIMDEAYDWLNGLKKTDNDSFSDVLGRLRGKPFIKKRKQKNNYDLVGLKETFDNIKVKEKPKSKKQKNKDKKEQIKISGDEIIKYVNNVKNDGKVNKAEIFDRIHDQNKRLKGDD